MPVSVLHVSQPADGGVARCVTDLVHDQVARGWRVAVACPRDGHLGRWIAAEGAEHLPWEAVRPPGSTLIRELSALRTIIRLNSPDIVHLHSSKAALAGRLVLRGRSPTIVQPHAWSFYAVDDVTKFAVTAWERFAVRWSNALVVVSSGEMEAGIRAGIHAAWRVVPNGIDLTRFSSAETDATRFRARRRLGIDEGPLTVCIGRLTHQKGQDVLLDAWPLVLRRIPSASLALVGAGPDEQTLRARRVPRVSLVGERDDVEEWLAAADVVAVPSRWEGIPYTALEAMGRSRSVVISALPGVRRDLGEAVAVVPIGDSKSLAEAISERLANPALAAEEGAAGRTHIESAHDVTKTTTAMAVLYLDVLGRCQAVSKSAPVSGVEKCTTELASKEE